MTRTQIYLDDDILRLLSVLGRKRKTTVSGLIREALRRVFGPGACADKGRALDAGFGLWSGRKDVSDPEAYVRLLRSGRRSMAPVLR